MSLLSILLCSQDEVNQIMETNLWLRHVSLWCMTVQMDLEQGRQVWIQPSVIRDCSGARLTRWIIHGRKLFKHIDPSSPII